jgi:hypothetical protein
MFRRNIPPASSGTKYVVSGIGSVTHTGYEEGGHSNQVEGIGKGSQMGPMRNMVSKIVP